MPRLPYGAETFVEQVTSLRKSAKYERGEPDGFDVIRSITFDKPTSKWLADAIDYIDDERIVDTTTEKDQLTVHFSDESAVADQRDTYPLAEAIEVAQAEAKAP